MPSMPRRNQPRALGGVVDRVAQRAQAGAVQRVRPARRPSARGWSTTATQPSACATSSQPSHKVSSSSARGSCRRRRRAPCQRLGAERAQQRRHRAASPTGAPPRRDDLARSARSRPGVGLISMFSAKPLAQAVARDGLQRRQRLAGVGARASRRHRAATARPRARRPRRRLASVVRSQRGVVQQERHAVGADSFTSHSNMR